MGLMSVGVVGFMTDVVVVGGCHGGGGRDCRVGCETHLGMGFTVFTVVLWARFMVVVKGCCGGGDG